MNDKNKGNSVALTQWAADLNKHVIKEQSYVRIALLIYTLLSLLSKSQETFPYNMKVPFRSVQRVLKLPQLWIWEHLYDMILWNSLIIGLQHLQTSVISTVDQLLTEYLICMHFPQREIPTHGQDQTYKWQRERERDEMQNKLPGNLFMYSMCNVVFNSRHELEMYPIF